MKKQDCFLLGKIFKMHGYKGEVNIYNNDNIHLNLSDIEFLFIKEENNELIPYFIEKIRTKKKHVLLVKLEDVNSENEALKILKREVYLPNKFLPEMGNINPNKLIVGFDVIDNTLGKIGLVDYINDKTPQKLIIVKNKEKNFFIPYHDNFILNIDLTKKILEVNIPQELIDIN